MPQSAWPVLSPTKAGDDELWTRSLASLAQEPRLPRPSACEPRSALQREGDLSPRRAPKWSGGPATWRLRIPANGRRGGPSVLAELTEIGGGVLARTLADPIGGSARRGVFGNELGAARWCCK